MKKDYTACKGSRDASQRYYLGAEDYAKTFMRVELLLLAEDDENNDESSLADLSVIRAVATDAATGYHGRGRNAVPFPRPDVASALCYCMKTGTPFSKFKKDHTCSVGASTFYKCRRKWFYLLNRVYGVQ